MSQLGHYQLRIFMITRLAKRLVLSLMNIDKVLRKRPPPHTHTEKNKNKETVIFNI